MRICLTLSVITTKIKSTKESIFIADQIDEEKNYSHTIDPLCIFVRSGNSIELSWRAFGLFISILNELALQLRNSTIMTLSLS